MKYKGFYYVHSGNFCKTHWPHYKCSTLGSWACLLAARRDVTVCDESHAWRTLLPQRTHTAGVMSQACDVPPARRTQDTASTERDPVSGNHNAQPKRRKNDRNPLFTEKAVMETL